MTRREPQGQRALEAEQRARRRAFAKRDRSQAPLARVTRLGRPGERNAHQVSTAHFQAAYPAVAEPGLGARGVYIGRDMHGGSFVYDPWILYAQGVVNDPNMIVIGRVGHGKSALVKSWMFRSRVFGRVCELVDLKGEYHDLVHAIGGEVLTFTPGGRTRLNPLTRLGSREMREGLLEAIARAMLERPLTQPEALGLSAALAAADRHADDADVCIPDVVAQLRDPDREAAEQLACSVRDAKADLRECALALQRLTHGPLRGMFDQPTQASEHVWDAPAVSLDLSRVGVGHAQSNLAIAIVMVCASAFLDAKRRDRASKARAAGREPDKTSRGNDECWRGLPIPGLADYYQSAFKLSRETGVQHILVLHRLSDLRAAGDDGSRQQRLAEGLLAEASTTVVYRQHAQEVPDCDYGSILYRTQYDVNVQGSNWDGGQIFGAFGGNCGWLHADNFFQGSNFTTCGNPSTRSEDFILIQNGVWWIWGSTDGMYYRNSQPCTEYADYYPWYPGNREVYPLRTVPVGAVDPNDPSKPRLKIRYVTKYPSADGSSYYIMVRDTAVPTDGGNWVFVPLVCFL